MSGLTLGSNYTAGENDSKYSTSFAYNGSLATPTLNVSRSGNSALINWDAISNAKTYTIRTNLGEIIIDASLEVSYLMQSVETSIYVYGTSQGFDFGDPTLSSWSSSNSTTITIATQQVLAPTIAWSGTSLTISSETGASFYEIYVDDVLYASTSNLTYDFSGYAEIGSHTIKVKAIAVMTASQSGTTYTIYTDSDYSSTVSLVVSQLDTPILSFGSGVFTWTSITNATSYDFYLNNVLVQSSADLSYTTSGATGTGYVIAQGTPTFTSGTLTIYLTSLPSQTLGYGTLDTPVLTATDNVLSWTAIDNADFYLIYEDGIELGSVNTETKSIEQIVKGSHTYNVLASSTSPTILNSALSNTITITWTQLNKPTLTNSIDGNTISVFGDYDTDCLIKLDINGYLLENASNGNAEQQIDISSKVINGENIAIARIFSTNPLVIPSIQSDRLYFVLANEEKIYKAFIGETSYGIQLPISLTFTHDETLECGSLTLDLEDTQDISTPFEAYQRIKIIIYNADGSEKKRWEMLIEEDAMSAIQYGENLKYLHDLTLISLTKGTQQVLLPDLTITQPLSLAGKIFEEADVDVIQSLKNKIIYRYTSSALISKTDFYWRISVGENEGNYYNSINSNGLLSKVAKGYSCLLPDWNISSVKVGLMKKTTVFKDAAIESLKVINYEYYSNQFYYPTKRWYIRRRETTDTEWTTLEATSKIRNNFTSFFVFIDNDNAPISQKYFSFDDEGIYDIYLWCDDISDSRIVNDISLTEEVKEANDPIIGGIIAVYHCEIVTATSEYTIDEDVITIGKALDKVVGAITPQRIINSNLINPTYSWNLLGHADDQCDEATWSGGKTLYEVLQDIGRQFGGIPRLHSNNLISFDILGETCVGNPLFVDEVSPIKSSSTMDNHASALISQAKNIVSEDNWEVYPYKDGWAAPRASSDDATYITRSNSCIKLPHPIHQLYEVRCKDMKHNGQEFIIYQVGSTQLVLESKIWGNQKDTPDGKGSSLVYTRGDNKILNLGALSPLSETEAVFGLASDTYVIGNIIHILSGSTITASDVDPSELLYRVIYRPYTDEVIRAEQADQSSEKAHSNVAFNQDASVISDKRLGKVMEDKASRLGNNSITKLYRFKDIEAMPLIGQVKVVDNETYFADKINVLIERTYVEATVSFTKNRTNIDPQVGLASEYRQYEIATDNFVTRQISVDTYAVVSFTDYNDADTQITSEANYGICENIKNFFNAIPDDRPADFYITTLSVEAINTYSNTNISVTKKSKAGYSLIPTPNLDSPTIKVDLDKINYTTVTGSNIVLNNGFNLHAQFRAIGNSITFYCETVDNYSFGEFTTTEETDPDPFSIKGSGKWVVRDARYVDDLGRVDAVHICLGTISNEALRYTVQSTEDTDEVIQTIGRKLPYCNFSSNPISYMENSQGLINNDFYIQKDNREKLAFQYACHFISFNSNIRVRSAFASHLYSPDFGVQGTISLVYLSSNPMSKEALSSNEFEIISQTNGASRSGNIVSILPNNTSSLAVTPTEDKWGWAYVINDGKIKPLIIVKQEMLANEEVTIPTLKITLTDTLPEWREEN